MQTAIETIEEIVGDIEDIQRKILSIEASAGEFTEKQAMAKDNAYNGLEWFKGYSIDRFKRAFKEEDS